MKLIYCPTCAAPLKKQNDTNYVCANSHPYYNNPRGTCSIIFMNDNHEILYAKRAHEPAAGKYDFPGGFLDYGENAYEAAIREAREELGLELAVGDLELIDCAVMSYMENISTCEFVFMCRQWKGTFTPADDVAACEWRSIDFFTSSEFAWTYPYLQDKLKRLA